MSKKYLKNEEFGRRYPLVDSTDLVLWLDQSDPRSYGDDQNWYDLSGNGNHATQSTGGDQPVIGGVDGLNGATRSFNGINHFMDCGNDASLDTTGGLSVAAWVMMDKIANGNRIIARYNNNVQEGFSLYAHGDGTFGWLTSDTAGAGNSEAYYSTLTYNTGQWYHVAGIHDGANHGIYVNGVEKIEAATYGIRNAVLNVLVGRDAGVASYFFGKISVVMYFTRVLTGAEIQQLFLADVVRHGGI